MLSLFESKVIIMGLFGKKKYEKNMTRDNQFLKNYAIKVNGLINFTEGNEKVTQELEALKKDFQYSIGTSAKENKKLEKKIENDYQALSDMLTQASWDEAEVIRMARIIRQTIVEITSNRDGTV
jgi:hypothetical protein